MIFQRTELLLGKENLDRLKNSHILIFGVGGVGGYVVEGLVRSGIGEITVVDFDDVDITNLNRQIIATTQTVGMDKVDVIKERALSINPNIVVNSYKLKFFKSERDRIFDGKKYDYIVDAIDIITAKMDIIEIAKELKIPIISSMGTGNKLEPTMLEVCDIRKTSVCPLAKVIRGEMKKRGLGSLKVVYSKEIPKKIINPTNDREKAKNIGSVSFVPSVAGLIIASEVVKDLCKGENL